jgi:hypothetical protein
MAAFVCHSHHYLAAKNMFPFTIHAIPNKIMQTDSGQKIERSNQAIHTTTNKLPIIPAPQILYNMFLLF